jgi:putative metallohydrolase (TIGR04338 family)
MVYGAGRATRQEETEVPRTLSITKSGRVRDVQKQRLYDAETGSGIRRMHSKVGKRLLVDEARMIPYTGYNPANHVLPNGKTANCSIEDAQRYVDHVVQSAWFQRRFGQRVITVHWKAGGNATGSRGGGSIALPPWSRNEAVILHEIAHCCVYDRSAADHGPEFAGIMLALTRTFIGKAAGDALKAAYREERVRTTRAALPAPTRAVVTLADRRAKAVRREQVQIATGSREAAKWLRLLVASSRVTTPWFGEPGTKTRARALATAKVLDPAGTARGLDDRATIFHVNVVETADTLRAAIKHGTFGPAGSKPRTYAGAVARRLDEIAKAKAPDTRRTYAASPARW